MRSSKPVTYFETFAVSIPFYTPPQLALPTYRFRFTLSKHLPNFVFSIATARGSCWCSDIGETISNEQPNLLIQNHTSITLPNNFHFIRKILGPSRRLCLFLGFTRLLSKSNQVHSLSSNLCLVHPSVNFVHYSSSSNISPI